MAKKKVYAVKKGRTAGIFYEWESCRASVEGFSEAEYKSFYSLEDAEAYLNGRKLPDREADVPEAKKTGQSRGERPAPGTLLAYVDGSYDPSLKRYAFGCVFILPDGRIKKQYGNGDNACSLQQRNVAGEMLGAMYAVRTAMVSGFSEIEIRYDYEGIEKWVTGVWRAKTELTQKYTAAMRKWGESLKICFTKVAAHSNVYYNEMADKTAKAGLREAEGVPKVCQVEELPDV